MASECVTEKRITEKAQAWQDQLADRTDHDQQVYAAGIRAGLEEVGFTRVIEVDRYEHNNPTHARGAMFVKIAKSAKRRS